MIASVRSRPRPVKPDGLVLYHGPSSFDGECIVVIATLHSENQKTGDMVQTWILRADCEPHLAIQHGRDRSVCWNCPARGNGNGTGNWCYVNAGQAPLQVYRSWVAGNYPTYDPRYHDHLLRGREIRMGAYGDPCAAPYRIWSNLARLSRQHTGYTHQWNQPRFWRFRQLLMASCETLAQAHAAHARGWRTFRSLPCADQRDPSIEIYCPSARVQCADCSLCRGASGARSICIEAHGSKPIMANYRKHLVSLTV
jgi:hypothetical protein